MNQIVGENGTSVYAWIHEMNRDTAGVGLLLDQGPIRAVDSTVKRRNTGVNIYEGGWNAFQHASCDDPGSTEKNEVGLELLEGIDGRPIVYRVDMGNDLFGNWPDFHREFAKNFLSSRCGCLPQVRKHESGEQDLTKYGGPTKFPGTILEEPAARDRLFNHDSARR